MDKLEELKNVIKKEIKENEQAMKSFADMNLFVNASACQNNISTLEQVLGFIAEIEGDENFF